MPWWPLTEEEALRRARAHIEAQGLPWTEPVEANRQLGGGWQIVTHAGHRGGNVWLSITRRGEIRGGTDVTPR